MPQNIITEYFVHLIKIHTFCKSSDDMMNKSRNNSMIIQKKSLADMVAEQLRQQITEGVYTIGDKLPTEPS